MLLYIYVYHTVKLKMDGNFTTVSNPIQQRALRPGGIAARAGAPSHECPSVTIQICLRTVLPFFRSVIRAISFWRQYRHQPTHQHSARRDEQEEARRQLDEVRVDKLGRHRAYPAGRGQDAHCGRPDRGRKRLGGKNVEDVPARDAESAEQGRQRDDRSYV